MTWAPGARDRGPGIRGPYLFNLLNPFALLGVLRFVAIFLTHGAIVLSLRTSGTIRDRAHKIGIMPDEVPA